MKPFPDRGRPGRGTCLAMALAWFVAAAGFCRADTLLSTSTFTYSGGTQTYTAPSGTQYIVIKAWGAGGGSGVLTAGGGGAFLNVRYNASGGQQWTVYVAGPGSGYLSGGWPNGGSAQGLGGAGGGGVTKVLGPGGAGVYAAGGGGGGNGSYWGGWGGAGGYPNGQDGSAASGGWGATVSGPGAGGSGDDNGNSGSGSDGGASGADVGYVGGGGGGGYYGGGGAASGGWSPDGSSGGGGGAGGSSHADGSYTSITGAGGSYDSPGGTGDAHYPGNGIGYGGGVDIYTPGNPGYVVIIAYSATSAPSITNGGTRTYVQGQPINITVTTTGNPAPTFSQTGLPSGLGLNSSTGQITGSVSTPGTYNATITATNSQGPASATFTWVIQSAQLVTNASVLPNSIAYGQSVSLYRDGSALAGVAYTEGTIWKPGGGYYSIGVAGLGGPQSYTPDAGPGEYWLQFRLVDIYYNYKDQWIPFEVDPRIETLPYTTGYDSSEGYLPGSLHAQKAWMVPFGLANVSTSFVQAGTYGLKLEPGSQVADVKNHFTQTQNWVFVDVYARPVADTTPGASSVMDYGASRIGFVKVTSGLGAVYVYDGNGNGTGTWIDTGYRFTLGTGDQAASWLRLTVRHDYSRPKWDLYIGGTLVDYDLGMVSNLLSSFTELNWWGHGTGTAAFDTFTVTTTNPMWTDADHDGMPDSWENAYGLSTSTDNRNEDPDHDGLTNIEEYFQGKNPIVADLPPNGDYDGDGMPNGWESSHGLNPTNPSDATGDPDGDGISNLDEYLLGLDPQAANSDSGNSNQLKILVPIP